MLLLPRIRKEPTELSPGVRSISEARVLEYRSMAGVLAGILLLLLVSAGRAQQATAPMPNERDAGSDAGAGRSSSVIEVLRASSFDEIYPEEDRARDAAAHSHVLRPWMGRAVRPADRQQWRHAMAGLSGRVGRAFFRAWFFASAYDQEIYRRIGDC
jgi:hypothetical protein